MNWRTLPRTETCILVDFFEQHREEVVDFVVFCNDKKLFHFSYQRYLENQIRSVFGLEGTPITITIRQKGEDDG